MDLPLSANFDGIDWQPHPTLAGIEIKLLQNKADFAPKDVMMARVAEASEIPWHVHAVDSEIAFVVRGEGVLYSAATEARDSFTAIPVSMGNAVVVPPGVWHCLKNVGSGELLVFASHTG